MIDTTPRPPRPAPRHETTRREVRRGMLTMLDAILDHLADLEARLALIEGPPGADRHVDRDTCR